MKNKKLFIYIICAVLVVQFLVPLSMIIKRENILTTGTQYRFKTRPIDPSDPFRGKYVALGFENDQFLVGKDDEYLRGEMLYALLAVTSEGFAHIDSLLRHKPDTKDYLRLKVKYKGSKRVNGEAPDGVHQHTDNKKMKYYYHPAVYLHLPFDRYYMEESRAPRAEKLYRDFNQQKKHDSYVTVRVKNGSAVLEELYLGGKPINSALENEQ